MDQFSPQILRDWLAAMIGQVSDESFRQLLHGAVVLAGDHRMTLPYWSCIAAGEPQSAQAALSATTLALLTRVALGVLDDYQDDEEGALPCPLPQAMNVVLGLLSMAHSVLAEASQTIPLDRVAQAQKEYGQTLLQICEGQHRELTNQRPWSLVEYQTMISAKSVPQYIWECKAGALLAGAPSTVVEHLSTFGYHVGHLYQLANDYKGLRGLQGKSDLGQYWTWPTVYAWHVATQAQRDQLLAAWERQDKEIIHQLVDDLNARQFLVGASLDHRRQALQALEQLSNNSDPAVLATLQGLVNELTLLPDRLLANL